MIKAGCNAAPGLLRSLTCRFESNAPPRPAGVTVPKIGQGYGVTRSIPFAVTTTVDAGVIKDLTKVLAVSDSLEPLPAPAVWTT